MAMGYVQIFTQVYNYVHLCTCISHDIMSRVNKSCEVHDGKSETRDLGTIFKPRLTPELKHCLIRGSMLNPQCTKLESTSKGDGKFYNEEERSNVTFIKLKFPVICLQFWTSLVYNYGVSEKSLCNLFWLSFNYLNDEITPHSQ